MKSIGILAASAFVSLLAMNAYADPTCKAATICMNETASPELPPVTVMHGKPLWADASVIPEEIKEPATPPVSEKPLKALEAVKPQAVVATDNLDQPHKALTGEDLTVWNQFCRGQKPADVYEWRYNRCNGLDPEFKN